MGFKHKDKNGNETELKDLGLNHLKNIIAYIERRAKEGITVAFGGGCIADVDSLWYYEETYYGKKARDYMNYKKYVKELKRRSE
jgi:hypothetical protein